MTTPRGHPALPAGYRLRRPSREDAAAVVALKVAVDVSQQGYSEATIDEVREEWALPRFDPRHDLWLVEDGAGRVVGYALCWMEAPPDAIVADQVVHPGHRGRGLSAVLLDRCERRATELVGAAPGRAALLGVWSQESDAARQALFARRGYERVRTFFRLERRLDRPVDGPVWPPGIAARTFRRGRDEAAVHAAGEEAFRDHFRPAVMDLDEWLEFRFAREDLDADLWFVAWDGGEVAGAIVALETPRGGYLDELFVRRQWRGRGLGRALLLRACVELGRRGLPLAYLGVDATNPTGALHLYETAGFARVRTTFFYERRIAGV